MLRMLNISKKKKKTAQCSSQAIHQDPLSGQEWDHREILRNNRNRKVGKQDPLEAGRTPLNPAFTHLGMADRFRATSSAGKQ